MGSYNYDDFANSQMGMQNDEETEKKPQFLFAFLVGLGTSIIVGAAQALLGMWLEAEHSLVLCIGGVIVGLVITRFVPHRSIGGALIGLVLCPATYLIYQIIMFFYGYEYEENGDSTFWITLIGSALFGTWVGFNEN